MSAILDRLDPMAVVTAIGALAGFCVLMLFGLAVSQSAQRKRLRRRLARITGSRGGASPGTAAVMVTVRRDVADSSIASLDRLIKRVLPRPARLRERLAATGKRISLGEYILASLLLGLVSAIGLTAVAGCGLAVALLLSFAAGLGVPHKLIGMMIARRQRKFLAMFSEAIELIVRGLKSGVPLSESIKIVGQELPDPVGAEFRAITDAMVLGRTFDEALAAASKRIDLPEFRFFVVSLGIQHETGGNLSETLENLAVILRKRKQMKLKIRALSSEARASAYIVGSLPFLMFGGLTLTNPDYMRVLFDDPRGELVLGAAIGSLSLGVGIMIKMGKFQI